MNPKIYISLKKHFASLIENDNTKGALEWPHFYLDGSNFSYQFLLGSNLSPGINTFLSGSQLSGNLSWL